MFSRKNGAEQLSIVNLEITSGVLTVPETTTPTAEDSKGKVYTKNDNKLYFQDGAGSEHEITVEA